MLHLIVRKNERGVTLVEILITTVIVGILAAISLPHLLELFNNNQTKTTLDELQNTLREAQRQAIRQGQRCTISLEKRAEHTWMLTSTFPPGNPERNCLVSSTDESAPDGSNIKVKKILTKGIDLNTNLQGTTPNIAFSFKGNTTDAGTIVLSPSDGPGEKRCLAISNGLGIMRTGLYEGTFSPIDPDKCNTIL